MNILTMSSYHSFTHFLSSVSPEHKGREERQRLRLGSGGATRRTTGGATSRTTSVGDCIGSVAAELAQRRRGDEDRRTAGGGCC